jgi:mannitol-specific phosphotransferase system IIBC component
MSDSDEPITRQKKPLSEARLAAIERMKEGRKRSLDEKKKQKEEEKEAKKQMKKKIKMKVEEEMNGISSLPLDDKEFMEDLKRKAIEVIPKVEVKEIVEEEEEEEIIEIKQPVKKPTRGRPKKKKIVVNNYYEEESSDEEEEVVNNYHKKKKKKKKPVKVESSSEEEEDEYIEVVPEYEPVRHIGGAIPRNFNPYTNAMSGISFR